MKANYFFSNVKDAVTPLTTLFLDRVEIRNLRNHLVICQLQVTHYTLNNKGGTAVPTRAPSP